MNAATIQVAIEKRVARIRLDRPPLNILNTAMMRELDAAIAAAAPAADLFIFQGAGKKGFSAGAEVGEHSPERAAEMLAAFHGIFRRLNKTECITVAAVHGWCLGGGCELALFCDFLLATESAVFGLPEIKLGAAPPVAMVLLPRLAGMRTAADMILTGRKVNAIEAHARGLTTRLLPDDGLEAGVRTLAEELNALSPAVLKLARQELGRRRGFDFERELQAVEAFYLERLLRTHDAAEGIQAFLEKRTPEWQGR